eukprot:TRINITY_DN3192_c0_g1_i2.p1 TRINITY_DN3192_c0_g1~~TRINITY_DN3192_c0_g1_i2.p1  ORF type:complete len:126 (+),score=50.62 TRINITY_DN3192_c0_g1_i2:15-392(+)
MINYLLRTSPSFVPLRNFRIVGCHTFVRNYTTTNNTIYPVEILDPPPEMPTNCCGTGCKTCVWDLYFAEVEEYNNKLSALKAQQQQNLADSSSSSNSNQPPIMPEQIEDPSLKAFAEMEKKMRNG